jgi:hypothetical protein
MQVVGLAAPHVAGPAEAADHLIGDEQQVVFANDGLHLLPIRARRGQPTAGAHDRLADERANGVGAFAQDHFFKRRGQPGGVLFLALALMVLAVVVRIFGMEKTGVGQAEIGMHVSLAGGADGGAGTAMIPHLPSDNFSLPRLADRGVIVPDQFDRGVVRLRPRTLEQHLAHGNRSDGQQLFRQVDAVLVRRAAIQVVIS